MESIPLLIVLGLAGLVLGGEALVRGASKLASALGISPMIIGLTVVAFGTSTPELAVSLKAAFSGNADIALSNVVGSNIFNTLFILGVSAILSPLIIHSQMIKKEVPLMILCSVLLFILCLDKEISRIDGILLFLGILGYTTWLIFQARQHRKENQEIAKESEQEYGALRKEKFSFLKSSLFVVAGLGLVMVGADFLVKGAVLLAKGLGVSDTVIGLTIVAAGTSLPELVASVVATMKGERDIAVGNVIGSNIYNILAIVGLSGALSPKSLAVNSTLLHFDIPLMILTAALCWPLFRSDSRLSRKEGIFFLVSYCAYTAYLIKNASG